MKIYEFRSESTSYPEGVSNVETELFLSKDQAVQYMRNKALEYEKSNSSEEFYWAIDSDPEGAEVIELDGSRNSDVFGLFSVNEIEVNECLLKVAI